MLTRLGIVIVTLGLALKPACSATIELTGRAVDGHTLGVKIEGEIEPGDAEKLLKLYEYFGPAAASKVFLWSPGGNVQEAMKIGKLIRQLRLSAIAPDRLNTLSILGQLGVQASPSDKGNNLCASACVLAYAGGVTQTGVLLILHRPFPAPEVKDKLSDLEFEHVEKRAINEVRDYLREMEFPDYYIEKMIATSSQDGYIPTDEDLNEHPLPDIVPSIEEIILSKCESPSLEEKQKFGSYLAQVARTKNIKLPKGWSAVSPDMTKVGNKLQAKFEAYSKCQSEQLVKLQLLAWKRINEARVNIMCSQPELVAPKTSDCREYLLNQLTNDAFDRDAHAKPGDTPPKEF
jgi:hypothetical protein